MRSERSRYRVFGRLVVGVGVQADAAHHLAARLVDGDEGDGAGVVELGQAGDEGVAQSP